MACKSLILLIIGCSLIGCNTVKKSASKTEIKTDSIHAVARDSAAIVKKDSAGAKTDVGSYERETVYVYDTLYLPDSFRVYVPRIMYVKEKGNYAKTETAKKIQIDSSGKNEKIATTVNTERTETTKAKKSSRMPWWVIIVIVFALISAFAYLKYFKK